MGSEMCIRDRYRGIFRNVEEGKGQYGTMPFIVILENNLDSYRILSCNEVRDGLL